MCQVPLEKLFSQVPYLEQVLETNCLLNPYSKLVYALNE
jgi:hypothetical protein